MKRRFSFASLGAIVLLIVLLSLFVLFERAGSPPDGVNPVPVVGGGSWHIYFSDPSSEIAEVFRGGPDADLVEGLDGAQFSIDVAVYHMNLWSIRDALIRAHRRGVSVRVVTDSSHFGELEVQALSRAGIAIVEDGRPELMHHKFVVIDGTNVWTGSMNLTINGAYRNDNHLIHLRSRELAEDYLREFEEMFVEGRFGALSRRDTPNPTLELDGAKIEVYFSPDDGVQTRIVELIRSAEESIAFMAFSLTSDSIGDALLERHANGVNVRGVVETDQAMASGSETPRLQQAGLDVVLDRNTHSMHHKVFILDDRLVVLGSYNFTRSAEEKNDENVLIIHDPALASHFLIEFERIYQSGGS
jgi:phosphatidylserine/phosphatidylglycerophosphate/cardiolipin synthase-like enzyme